MTHSPTVLLEQLRLCEMYNLRPVLIFDQFEEFFFVDTERQQKQEFFEFLGECLNILPVKVILSLRVDYLHYLLKWNRLPSMGIINNDILGRNVLYELGNFSPSDAKSIIEQLTERSHFHLEPALIEELVQDLARELGEVRPIELQVVGAQLQTENITTLTQYRERCTKEELVKRYLDEVVRDCGEENQQTAEFLLYLLTDEKGTRPLKTRAELERDLQKLAADVTKEASKLDLILEIFVESGLVVLLKENPANRYQLVHDYLAEFIRLQQAPGLTQLMAELERERKQRLQTEEQLKQTEQAKQILTKANQQATQRIRIGSGVLTASFVVAGIVTLQAFGLVGKAQKITILERQGVATEKLFQFQEIEALLLALDAGQELYNFINKEDEPAEYPAASPVLALQTIVDNIHEQNQLKGHTGYVYSASFSPDGKRIVTASYDNTARVWEYKSLKELLSKGCQWLNDYLVINPKELEKLEVCQNESNLKAAAPFLLKEGEQEAKSGNIIDDAVATFRKAQKWDSRLKFDPKAKAQEFANKGQAEDLVAEGQTLAKEGKVEEAIANYTKAQKLDPKVEINADSWETLCWYGSLHRHAADVMFACEKAVQLAPNNGYIRDSRGVARALTGNTQGAIEDFKAYIPQINDKETKSQRQSWVKDLRAGKNPFTDAELKKLLQE